MSLLAAPAALAGKAERVPPDDLRLFDWTFEKRHPFVRRAVVLAPTHLAAGEKAPCLVLFHGFGEAKAGHEVGSYAWLERYGLGSSYRRLRHPPVASVSRQKYLSEARAAQLNAELEKRPFGGMVLVCPFTPNVWSFRSTPDALDALADFVAGELLDRVAAEIPFADTSPARTSVDGCSLGGFVSLEVFLRKPARFGALGVVQPAISSRGVARYVDAVAGRPGGAPPVHVETSRGDPYLAVSKELAAALVKKSISCDLIVPPGPHDQPFLRDVGTLELLHWHDRVLHPPP
jgi:enterochelin esterase-like enzyme